MADTLMKRSRIWLFALWLGLGLCIPASTQAGGSAPSEPDVRVLIDISGSMKKNDPKNLRRSALRLLVGLLPEGARSGIWTFGQYVNMEVPLGKVNKAWKTRAMDGAEKIHSRGLYTNIEGALRRASEDWQGRPGNHNREMLLLTDGMVDVSKDAAADRASRARILNQLVAQFKRLGAKVHTVALSERADHELMRQLSGSTGGWYEQVSTADRLQRVFLRMFEQVSSPDTLPLKDNLFQVDKSVRELTLLVFRSADAQPTRVIPPLGKALAAGSAPGNVEWHQDQGYDLLTVSNPKPGKWKISAELDPDNRAMVVTDLKMNTEALPNRVVLGQNIPLMVSFSNQGAHIQRKSFLDLIEVKLEQHSQTGISEPRPSNDDGIAPDEKAGDGYFTQALEGFLEAGRLELVLSAAGKTFTREKRKHLDVVAPLAFEIGSSAEQNDVKLAVTLQELVDPATVSMSAVLEQTDGTRSTLEIKQDANNEWHASLDPAELDAVRAVAVSIKGVTHDGYDISFVSDPKGLPGKPPSTQTPMDNTIEPDPVSEKPANAEPDAAVDWTFNLIVLLAGNLVLVLLGGGFFWYLRRKKKENQILLLETGEVPA